MLDDLIDDCLVVANSQGSKIGSEEYAEDLSLEYLSFLEKEANNALFVNDTEARLDAANICAIAANKWLRYALKEKSQSIVIYQKIIGFYTTSTTQCYEYLLATQGLDTSMDVYKRYFSRQSVLLVAQFNSSTAQFDLLEKVLGYMRKIADLAVKKYGRDVVCSLLLKSIKSSIPPEVSVHLYKLAYDYLDAERYYSVVNPSALLINNYHAVFQGLCASNNALEDNDSSIQEIVNILNSELEAMSSREMALHRQGCAVPDMEYAGRQQAPQKTSLRFRLPKI